MVFHAVSNADPYGTIRFTFFFLPLLSRINYYSSKSKCWTLRTNLKSKNLIKIFFPFLFFFFFGWLLAYLWQRMETLNEIQKVHISNRNNISKCKVVVKRVIFSFTSCRGYLRETAPSTVSSPCTTATHLKQHDTTNIFLFKFTVIFFSACSLFSSLHFWDRHLGSQQQQPNGMGWEINCTCWTKGEKHKKKTYANHFLNVMQTDGWCLCVRTSVWSLFYKWNV